MRPEEAAPPWPPVDSLLTLRFEVKFKFERETVDVEASEVEGLDYAQHLHGRAERLLSEAETEEGRRKEGSNVAQEKRKRPERLLADFPGDAMNIHKPIDWRYEARSIPILSAQALTTAATEKTPQGTGLLKSGRLN